MKWWKSRRNNKVRKYIWENCESAKIQEFIKQEVSNILLRELKDPRLGFVTVTDARITGDLREARYTSASLARLRKKKIP